jgi:peptidoglycan L-alanyl-D-glutamate endopeptidase CwlK
MLIFVALLYFCLACSVIWIACFASRRAVLARLMLVLRERFDQGRQRWQVERSSRIGMLRRDGRQMLRALVKFVRRRWIVLAIGLPIVVIPALLALVISKPGSLPGYEDDELVPDEQVAALLKGEQLVPPVALPPLAFTTREVEQVRPMLVDASRNWGLLRPEFSQRLLLIFKIMKEKYGYQMVLLEGYRSPARQDMLARLGNQVTNARAYQSWHQYGLAADCAFWRDGRLIISEKDPWAMRGYRLYGEVAESLGLTWGGRWTMMDLGHTELRLRGVMGH